MATLPLFVRPRGKAGLPSQVHLPIGIYTGPGSSPKCVRAIHLALKAAQPLFQVVYIKPRDFKDPGWIWRLRGLCMPGGRDLPYLRLLGPLVAAQIRQFVRVGGRYFGSCAGAYFAAQQVSFDRGGPLEVMGRRPLRFWPGTAVGPMSTRCFAYGTEQGAQACALVLQLSASFKQIIGSDGPVATYTNGGCAFVHDAQLKGLPRDVRVVARYSDDHSRDGCRLPAAIRLQLGRGRVLLWGLHPELDGHDAAAEVASALAASSGARRRLLAATLRWLLAP